MGQAAFFQIVTAVGSREAAGAMADHLVSSRLAGCVQVVGPVTSTYRWRDQVENETEWLCLVKTTGVALDSAMEAIRAAHTYEEPEITATPIVAGSPGYLGWLAGVVTAHEG